MCLLFKSGYWIDISVMDPQKCFVSCFDFGSNQIIGLWKFIEECSILYPTASSCLEYYECKLLVSRNTVVLGYVQQSDINCSHISNGIFVTLIILLPFFSFPPYLWEFCIACQLLSPPVGDHGVPIFHPVPYLLHLVSPVSFVNLLISMHVMV